MCLLFDVVGVRCHLPFLVGWLLPFLCVCRCVVFVVWRLQLFVVDIAVCCVCCGWLFIACWSLLCVVVCCSLSLSVVGLFLALIVLCCSRVLVGDVG